MLFVGHLGLKSQSSGLKDLVIFPGGYLWKTGWPFCYLFVESLMR